MVGRARPVPADALDAAQAHTAALVAGTRPLVVVVGPAGTGETTMLRAAADELAIADRPVFGLAPSAAAAEVLGQEAGTTADTVDKLLVEYAKSGQVPDQRYLLPPGTTVIVDEAGMLSAPKLQRLPSPSSSRRTAMLKPSKASSLTSYGPGRSSCDADRHRRRRRGLHRRRGQTSRISGGKSPYQPWARRRAPDGLSPGTRPRSIDRGDDGR